VGPDLTARLVRLALPVWVGAVTRNALGTLRQTAVPRGLRASGFTAEAALAGYGAVSGMALPLLLFPACLPGAVAELLVPALTRLQARGETAVLRERVRTLLRGTFLLSLAASAVFFLAADVLGGVLYRSREAAKYIRILSPMAALMYTDIVTDGCLKGLGEMLRSMTYNVAEAVLGLALTWTLLPRYALAGYILTLYVCEIFNFTLSITRLKKVLAL
jgi:stage V sporulation protein B